MGNRKNSSEQKGNIEENGLEAISSPYKQQKLYEKLCRDCREVKPVDDFYIKEKRSHSTRYFSRCKDCYRLFYRRPGGRRLRTIGLEKVLTKKQLDRRKKAWKAVANAVYRGKILKPNRCERCGKKVLKKNLHGHHKNHRLKLNVHWLCENCHRKIDTRKSVSTLSKDPEAFKVNPLESASGSFLFIP